MCLEVRHGFCFNFQAKKQFTMNPNADIFRSVYNEPSSDLPSGDQNKSEIAVQSAGDGQLKTFAQTARDSFQGITLSSATLQYLFKLLLLLIFFLTSIAIESVSV